jgi:hypothetical protein
MLVVLKLFISCGSSTALVANERVKNDRYCALREHTRLRCQQFNYLSIAIERERTLVKPGKHDMIRRRVALVKSHHCCQAIVASAPLKGVPPELRMSLCSPVARSELTTFEIFW